MRTPPIVLEMPDDTAALPGWLDRRVVGMNLGRLAAELEAIQAAGPPPAIIEDALGDRLEAVLDRGLGVLTPDRIHALLVNPRLLLDLQERVAISGGTYWQRLAESERRDDQVHGSAFDRGKVALASLTSPAPAASPGPADARSFGVVGPTAGVRRPQPRRWVAAGLAIAASLLVGVLAVELLRNANRGGDTIAGWGWSRPGALPQDLPPRAYLERLADTAGDWFKKRPEDRAGVARRLDEFRQGCSVLIEAEHRPLSAEDRAWLVERCRAWLAKLDADKADLTAGADTLSIRARTDATINTLISALRARAGRLS